MRFKKQDQQQLVEAYGEVHTTNVAMDDPKNLILHIKHARKSGDTQKVKALTDRLRTVALRLDMLDDPDILDIIET
jgi:hypothetical protein